MYTNKVFVSPTNCIPNISNCNYYLIQIPIRSALYIILIPNKQSQSLPKSNLQLKILITLGSFKLSTASPNWSTRNAFKVSTTQYLRGCHSPNCRPLNHVRGISILWGTNPISRELQRQNNANVRTFCQMAFCNGVIAR